MPGEREYAWPIVAEDDGFRCANPDLSSGIAADGRMTVGDRSIVLAPEIDGERPTVSTAAFAISSEVMVRHTTDVNWGDQLSGRLTADLHASGAIHVHVRIGADVDRSIASASLVTVDGLPQPVAVGTGASRHIQADGLALMVRKYPWKARWNDVGAHGHGTITDSTLAVADRTVRLTARDLVLAAGETIEAAITIRPATGSVAAAEAGYEHPDELRYIPEGEYRHHLTWESDDVWLGPPIFDGCPQRPHDQLITRPLGLNVLARKRFTWANEDFSLWRLTGKSHYAESGVKKAFALITTQNAYGGWYEGVEFYNLPPKHHHMYDQYISGMFLLDAYDATGYDGFLAAAERTREFWCTMPPPANGHVDVGPDAWWFRWGGYINAFGYTDERCVLNTHSGATAFLAALAARTGDAETRASARRGLNAVLWGLEHGVQRGDGQFLYCLSQIDPTLERPGDPPYIKLDLVPQIEDVYTVATSYRLMIANREFRDPAIDAAITRALDYWWTAYRAGTVYTYRAYASLAYAVAAGDIDLRYALALPEILRDPQHFTSMHRGLSAFVAPAGLGLVEVRVGDAAAVGVEPVFLRRTAGEAVFAIVNVEQALRRVPVSVRLPGDARPIGVEAIDPASPQVATPVGDWSAADDGYVHLALAELGEFGVVVVRVTFDETA